MRILNVHNRHIGAGGTEMMFEAITRLLRSRGQEVISFEKDNRDLQTVWQKVNAFGSAVYSPSARREFARLLEAEKPDLVHAHNLYPQLSVSVLDACREVGMPVVLHVHDYKITCPTAQHIRNGRVCTECTGGKEHWCAIHNCRGSLPMSVAYALRNAFARASGKIHDAVSLYIGCSSFVRDLIVSNGYPAERAIAIPNFFDLPPFSGRSSDGEYVAYIGRISPEKGLDVLLEAAQQTRLPVRIAGDPTFMPGIEQRAPANVTFVGKLNRAATDAFLERARMLVVPSVWWEAFGLVGVEAMSRELPVIASNMGGLPEVVDDGITGLLTPPNDAAALGAAMRRLWDDRALARRMGLAGREKAERLYTPNAYYQSLMRAYGRVAGHATRPMPRAEGRAVA
ncbi:MAG TPA: glycosyltransferase [Tepidisphaeraceae bacterium]|nr:glycosyltransferase [Tepidisphaeraceae bacterium]